MAEALLGFGGNVGDVRANLNEAVALFADGKDVTLRSASSHYLTPPWGVLDQPPFINHGDRGRDDAVAARPARARA